MKMTDKQKGTLVLFAQNYSLAIIASKQKVSLSTVRERIKSLSKNHPKEFENAVRLRSIYKETKQYIRRAKSFETINEEDNPIRTKW